MKLAICLFKYFPYGGLQRDFLRIAMLLAEKYSIEVFTTAWQGEIPANLSVNIVPVTGLTNHRRMQSFSKKAIQQAKQSGCEFIVGFNKMPGLDIYFAADNCYASAAREKHGLLYRLTPRYQIYSALERSVFFNNKKTKILALVEQQKKAYQEMYQTPNEQFYLLPAEFNHPTSNFTDKTVMQKIRQAHGIQEDEYMVLMVCSAFKTKGVDRALTALQRLPSPVLQKTHLVIIGKERPDSWLKLAKKLKIDAHTQFAGAKENVFDYMRAADLFLHPARQEAAGKVILEAMSCGLPVLTTDTCGYAEHVLKADAGIVLPQKEIDSLLSETMRHMLTANDRRLLWRKQALDYVANYSAKDLAVEAVDVIRDKMSSPRRRGSINPFINPYKLEGTIHRIQPGRKTIAFTHEDKTYFAKIHTGVGWKEIIKNLLQFRWPIISAQPEWNALSKLQTLGIKAPVPVAFGKQGINPARLKSFIITEAITSTINLEEFLKTQNVPEFSVKKRLIEMVARIAKTLHENGMNHRDFYLCHFLLDVSTVNSENLGIYLIDLHCAHIRKKVPLRWKLKDISGLYFSTMNFNFTQRDYLRFVRCYTGESLRETLRQDKFFWRRVSIKASRLYRKLAI